MQRLIRSRTGWLAIALLVVMAAFVLRLFQLQILQYGKYTELARASQQRQFYHSCGARENLHDGRKNASSCGA